MSERLSYFFAALIFLNGCWDAWKAITGPPVSFGPPHWMWATVNAFAAFELLRRGRRANLQRRIEQIRSS